MIEGNAHAYNTSTQNLYAIDELLNMNEVFTGAHEHPTQREHTEK